MHCKKNLTSFLCMLFAAAFIITAGLVLAPSNARADALKLNEIGNKWKKSGEYSFRLSKKNVLYCKGKNGKTTVVAKDVFFPFCENGKAVYQILKPETEYEDSFDFYYYEPGTAKRGKYTMEMLANPVRPIFYYKGHLMMYMDLDYGTLYCINTNGDVKQWKTIALVPEMEGYSWSFKRIGDLFYYNDRYFMNVNKTSVGIFNMKNDSVKTLKNAFSAVLQGNKIYYVCTKIRNDYLPAQNIKVYSCAEDGSGKKLVKSFRLRKKIHVDYFDTFADSKAVYYKLDKHYYKMNYKTGKTAEITRKEYKAKGKKLTVIGW